MEGDGNKTYGSSPPKTLLDRDAEGDNTIRVTRYVGVDRIALVAVPVLVFIGCGLAGFGDTAGEVFTGIGEDAMATMPDPSSVNQPGGITPTQFWATWGATLAMHEGRKLIRLFMKNKF